MMMLMVAYLDDVSIVNVFLNVPFDKIYYHKLNIHNYVHLNDITYDVLIYYNFYNYMDTYYIENDLMNLYAHKHVLDIPLVKGRLIEERKKEKEEITLKSVNCFLHIPH